MYYDTDQFAGSMTATTAAVLPTAGNSAPSINPGDIIEYLNDSNGRQPVYNVTQGFPFTLAGGTYTSGSRVGQAAQFVPMTINPDTGTITFSAPSLPNGPSDRFNRKWTYVPVADPTDPSHFIADLTLPGYTDLTLTNTNMNPSPLTNATKIDNTTTTTLTGDANAHPVPGSVRVYGPDTTQGPGSGALIPYTEVNSAVGNSALGTIGEDQYAVDYAHNTLELQAGAIGPIQVIYDYQANMTLTNPAPTPVQPLDLPTNTYLPMQVKVDYQTRDLIDVSIGVRIYDVTNNRAQVIPSETKVKIGNSNR